jgi:pyridoxine 4-dehydrogenase
MKIRPRPRISFTFMSRSLEAIVVTLLRRAGCVDSRFRGRSLHFMAEKSPGARRSSMHHGVTRRKFLGTTIAGGATILAGGLMFQKLALAAATSAAKSSFLLGGDLSVSRLGFGAMRLTGEGIWGWPADRDNARKVLRRAIELGVNLIDTADAYGPEVSELQIAEALHPYPAGLVIATKGGLTRPGPGRWVPDGRPEYLTQCVEKSLKRLKLERIDLYQLHRIDAKVPVEESLGALKVLQDAGKIRHVGLSEVTPKEIEQARKVLPIVSVQNQYNIANRKSEDTLAYCEKENLGFMPWSPIGGGRSALTKPDNALEAEAKRHGASAVQLALAWLLQRSPVMLPIPGTSSLAHLEENIAAAKLQLSPADWKTIEALVQRA